MLLHDVGHGPFSHALESVFFPENAHEDMSIAIMEKLNTDFDGKLSLAISMFTNSYKRAFFHQLITAHIDLDRLDYLKRDSFYSGVTEGNINSDRLIAMMRVHDDQLVFHKKAVYSIEKFLLARRMMYWSLYLHKTSFVAEELLIRFFKRATALIQQVKEITVSNALGTFLLHPEESLQEKLPKFVLLDDVDVWMCLKASTSNPDRVLATLATMLLERKLPKIVLSDKEIDSSAISQKRADFSAQSGFTEEETVYFVFSGSFHNQGYAQKENPIQLCDASGNCTLFDSSPEVANIPSLVKRDTKFFLAYPKQV